MKKAIILIPALLLLASCTDSATVSPLANEVSISEAAGVEKYQAIADPETILSNLGDKCIRMEEVINVDDVTAEEDGIEGTLKSRGDWEMSIDRVNGRFYSKDYAYMSLSGTSGDENVTLTMEETAETWIFDNKQAIKNVASVTMTGTEDVNEVDHYIFNLPTYDIDEEAVGSILSIMDIIEDANFESIQYYGNSKDYDLRISAKSGNYDDTDLETFDISFVDGLPTKLVAVYAQSIITGDATKCTDVTTISYPSSLNIDLPDLDSEEWASANQ